MSRSPSRTPPSTLIHGVPAHHIDRFQAPLKPYAALPTGQDLLRAFFSNGPRWVEGLFAVRNRIVRAFGLKTGKDPAEERRMMATRHFVVGDRIGLFEVFALTDHEALIGADDRHLDFRVSLLATAADLGPTLHITTTVWFHNRWGRLYFLPVRPFHGMVVPAMLRSMVAKL